MRQDEWDRIDHQIESLWLGYKKNPGLWGVIFERVFRYYDYRTTSEAVYKFRLQHPDDAKPTGLLDWLTEACQPPRDPGPEERAVLEERLWTAQLLAGITESQRERLTALAVRHMSPIERTWLRERQDDSGSPVPMTVVVGAHMTLIAKQLADWSCTLRKGPDDQGKEWTGVKYRDWITTQQKMHSPTVDEVLGRLDYVLTEAEEAADRHSPEAVATD